MSPVRSLWFVALLALASACSADRAKSGLSQLGGGSKGASSTIVADVDGGSTASGSSNAETDPNNASGEIAPAPPQDVAGAALVDCTERVDLVLDQPAVDTAVACTVTVTAGGSHVVNAHVTEVLLTTLHGDKSLSCTDGPAGVAIDGLCVARHVDLAFGAAAGKGARGTIAGVPFDTTTSAPGGAHFHFTPRVDRATAKAAALDVSLQLVKVNLKSDVVLNGIAQTPTHLYLLNTATSTIKSVPRSASASLLTGDLGDLGPMTSDFGVGTCPATGSTSAAGFCSPSSIAAQGSMVALADQLSDRVLLWRSFSGGAAELVFGQPSLTGGTLHAPTGPLQHPEMLASPYGVALVERSAATDLVAADTLDDRISFWLDVQSQTTTSMPIPPSFVLSTVTSGDGATMKLRQPKALAASDGVFAASTSQPFQHTMALWYQSPTTDNSQPDILLAPRPPASAADAKGIVALATDGHSLAACDDGGGKGGRSPLLFVWIDLPRKTDQPPDLVLDPTIDFASALSLPNGFLCTGLSWYAGVLTVTSVTAPIFTVMFH